MGVRRSRRGVIASDGTTFDPLMAIPWLHAHWVDGPLFKAQGFTDGITVTVLPDEMGTGRDPSTGTGLIYRASDPNWNGRATTEWDGVVTNLRHASTIGVDVPPPWSFVMLGLTDDIDQDTQKPWACNGAASGDRVYYESNGDYMGGTGTGVSNPIPGESRPFLWAIVFDPTTSVGSLNGVMSYGSAATRVIEADDWYIGYRHSTQRWKGDLTFMGWTVGNVLLDPAWAAFEAWAASYYAISMTP